MALRLPVVALACLLACILACMVACTDGQMTSCLLRLLLEPKTERGLYRPIGLRRFVFAPLLNAPLSGKLSNCVRWGRSADNEARQRREAKLVEIGDLSSIPLDRISDVAANVSIAYKDDIWQNDMIFKDQDDCSKMLVCELNRSSI